MNLSARFGDNTGRFLYPNLTLYKPNITIKHYVGKITDFMTVF